MYLEVLSRKNSYAREMNEDIINIELAVRESDNRLKLKLKVDNNDKIDGMPKTYLSYTYDDVELDVMRQVNSKQMIVGHSSGCKATINLNWNELVEEINKFCKYNSFYLWSY